jgi:hypothetical protein
LYVSVASSTTLSVVLPSVECPLIATTCVRDYFERSS